MTTKQATINDTSPPIKVGRNRRLPPAETRFKKGQSGNPKGRPKSILSKKERLQLLSEIAKKNLKRGNPVEAIREQNRMEGVYADFPIGQDNRVINIFISGDEAKQKLEKLLAGEKPKEGDDGQERTDKVTGSALQGQAESVTKD